MMSTDSAQRSAPTLRADSGARPSGPTRGAGGPATPKRRRQSDNLAGYIFLSPWLLGFLGLTLGPMLISLYLAFTDYNLFTDPEWIGFGNFTRMAEDQKFWQSVQITLVYVLIGTPIKLA